MPVAHRAEEFNQVPEFPVDVDLLQICLGFPLRVNLVLCIGSLEENFSLMEDGFFFDEGATDVVLGKSYPVFPQGPLFVIANGHANFHVRVPACC